MQMRNYVNAMLRAALMALTLALSAAPVSAGESDDAFAAYARSDYAEAARLYRILAEQGDTDAQATLGAMYDYGQGVSQDYAEAVRWHRKAAEQGHAGAQHGLSYMYGTGQGVPQDHVLAHMWANLAAAQGEAGALHNRDGAANLMTSEQIAEAQRLAREWKPK
jgi:TPR repeat protein